MLLRYIEKTGVTFLCIAEAPVLLLYIAEAPVRLRYIDKVGGHVSMYRRSTGASAIDRKYGSLLTSGSRKEAFLPVGSFIK